MTPPLNSPLVGSLQPFQKFKLVLFLHLVILICAIAALGGPECRVSKASLCSSWVAVGRRQRVTQCAVSVSTLNLGSARGVGDTLAAAAPSLYLYSDAAPSSPERHARSGERASVQCGGASEPAWRRGSSWSRG